MANSWIGRTRQGWKLLLFCTALIASAVFLFVGVSRFIEGGPLRPFLATMGLLFGAFFSGHVLLWLSLKCPNCGKRVFGHVLRRAPGASYFVELLHLENCPLCNR
jgi:hypothetical protein